jgi:arsenate reductase
LFRENNVDFEKVNYFVDALSAEKLRDLLRKAKLTPFEILRKNDPVFKERNLSPETPPDEIVKLIVENPGLLQRPIVEVGDRAVLARPIEKALEIIKAETRA